MFKILLLFISIASFGAENISYSGRLVQSSGAPIAGPVDLILDIIVNDGSSDSVECSLTVTNVSLSNGVFNVDLDYASTCASSTKTLAKVLSDSAKASHTNYIRITDQTNSKVYTKQKISNTPIALISKYANEVIDGAISQKSLLGVSANCSAAQVLKTNADGSFYCANDESGAGTITGVSANAPLSASAGPSVTLSLSAANGSTDGYLSSADWNTFNNKVGLPSGGNAAHYLRGDQTWSTLADDVENTVLANFSPVSAAVSNTDTVVQAISKLQGQITTVSSGIPTNTDGLAEGSTNLYFTDTRAQGAVVSSVITDDVTTKSPSEDAVFEALALKQNQIVQSDAITPGRVQVSMQNGVTLVPYGTNAGETSEVQFKELVANGANYVGLKAPDSITSDIVFTLAGADGTSGQVLSTNGSGVWGWSTIGGSSLAGDSVDSSKIVDGSIVNADINASAAIDTTKLAAGSVDNTEFSYLNGVTSAIQTQINNKVDKTTTINGKALSANVTLVTTDVAEGTNLYFTDARAKAASVSDAIVNGVLDVAPSQNAVNDALALKANASSLPNYVAKADLTNCSDADKKLSWNGTAWSCTSIVSLAGDVTGAIGSNTVVALQGRSVNSGAPSTNDVLTWNGTSWAPLALPSSSDNLGNHTATQNLNLSSYKLVGQGGTNGISIDASGNVSFGTTVGVTIGPNSTAGSSWGSLAGGWSSSATSISTFAFGSNVTASNWYAFASGQGTTASGRSSAAFGEDITVSGDNSIGFGLAQNGTPPVVSTPSTMAIMGGKVGIGTTTPLSKLNVDGGAGVISLSPGTLDHTYMQFFADSDAPTARSGYFGFGSSGTSLMTISNETATGHISLLTNSNVGISTTNPTAKLHVNAPTGDATIRITADGGDSAEEDVPAIHMMGDGTNTNLFIGMTSQTPQYAGVPTNSMVLAATTGGTGVGSGFHFVTGTTASNSPKMSIVEGGNVGIGTTTPMSKLTVGANVFTSAPLSHSEGGLLVINGNDFGGLGLIDRDGSSATANDYSTVLFYGDDLGEDLHLSHWRSGASTLRHDVTIKGETGRVGFGTTNPESIIHVVGGAPYMTWEETDTTQKFYTGVDGSGWWIRQGTTGNPDIFTVKNNGFVGINDSTPLAALSVGGSVAASGWIGAGCEGACSTDAYVINYADGRIVTYDGSTASCTKAGGSATFSCSSDERLKNTVEDFNDGLNYVLRLRPRTYYWNKDDKHELQYGFIAQEVQKVIPHAISEQERPEGVFLSLDQGAFTPYIVNAIQELNEKVESDNENSRKIASLQTEVETLRKENQDMKEALCSIKPDLAICN